MVAVPKLQFWNRLIMQNIICVAIWRNLWPLFLINN
jgi:hypothetical protein